MDATAPNGMSLPSPPPTALPGRQRAYVMVDQMRGKVLAIMGEAGPAPHDVPPNCMPPNQMPGSDGPGNGTGSDSTPLLSRPGWVAVALLIIAMNVMAVLPLPA